MKGAVTGWVAQVKPERCSTAASGGAALGETPRALGRARGSPSVSTAACSWLRGTGK